MGMRTVAIANQKGGVGKTTLTVNVGAALAESGKRVLLVDLDEQANCTSAVELEDPLTAGSRSIVDLLFDPGIQPADVIRATKHSNLDIIPAVKATMKGANDRLVSTPGGEHIIHLALTMLEGYDYVLLDCPPALNRLTLNALTAAGEVIVPVKPDRWSLEGLHELTSNMTLVQTRLNPALRTPPGIVCTFFEPNTTLSREVLDILQDTFPDQLYDTCIKKAAKIAQSSTEGRPIVAYASSSESAHSFRNLASEIAAQQ